MNTPNNTNSTLNTPSKVVQHIVDVIPSTIAQYYNFEVASGDFMNFSRSSNGQQYTEISMSPLSTGDEQTLVEYRKPFSLPFYSEIEASMSQRPKGQYAVMEITDKDTSYVDEPTEYTFTSVSQTTTTLTVALNAAFDGWLGSWVDIYGLLDNRFNYTNLCVASISSDKKTLTFTTSDEATITSLTATPASLVGGKLKRQAKLLLAGNALGMRFSGTSATSTAYLSRSSGGSIKESGTIGGVKTITSASSAPVFTAGSMGQNEIKATSRFRVECEPEIIVFGDKPIDAQAAMTLRNSFTAVKPVGNQEYYVRFRAVTPKSISRPVAKIVSATKATATTTATIVTDVPHGLTTASYVTIKGIANQTVFANLTTPTVVASVVNANTFTIVIGTATIATSYGGMVVVCNGQVDQQGIIAQVPQSVARDASGLVTVVGSGTWSGLNIGEYVNLYGIRNVTNGGDLGFDGVYKVHNTSTTTLLLEQVKDIAGNYVYNGTGANVTPSGGVVTTTNCGGAVILRTTLRSHDIVLGIYGQSLTKILGQGSSRTDLAMPVVHLGTISASTTEAALLAPSIGTYVTVATAPAGVSLKATAGNVYAVTASNVTASAIYLKLYNKASAPTLASDIPLITIPVPANSCVPIEFGRLGLRFATGIAYVVTGGIAATDTVAVTAGSQITIQYV